MLIHIRKIEGGGHHVLLEKTRRKEGKSRSFEVPAGGSLGTAIEKNVKEMRRETP